MYKTAILVLNWNKPDLTLDSVNSILKINSRKIDYQIIIIDNGSSDDSLAIFNKHYQTHPKVKIITTNSNLGFAGGNNFGIHMLSKTILTIFYSSTTMFWLTPTSLSIFSVTPKTMTF